MRPNNVATFSTKLYSCEQFPLVFGFLSTWLLALTPDSWRSRAEISSRIVLLLRQHSLTRQSFWVCKDMVHRQMIQQQPWIGMLKHNFCTHHMNLEFYLSKEKGKFTLCKYYEAVSADSECFLRIPSLCFLFRIQITCNLFRWYSTEVYGG